jgi:small-conductance mechanosensitive channel
MKRSFSLNIPLAVIFLITLWTGAGFPAISSGQEVNDEKEKSAVINKTAQVKVDGNVLFYVVGSASYPADERAGIISQRIISAASDRSIPVDSVKTVEKEDHLKVYAGKEFIMMITSDDSKAEGIDRKILAGWINKRIKTAITSWRQERSGPVLLRQSLHAFGAVVLLIIILFAFLWLIRRMNRGLENRIRSKIDSMENMSFRLIRSASLWKAIHLLFRTVKIVIIVLITAAFLQYILGLFPFTKGFAAYTLGLFLNPVISMGKGFLNFLPSLAFLIVIYLVTRYLLRLIKLFFTGIQDGGIKLPNFDDDWAMPTFKILRIVVIAFALVIAYPYIPGSETSAFKGISVFLGVMFSLGSSSFISNIIAGYSMTYRGAFKPGDLVQVDDQVGYVEDQKLLVTRLRSRKNEEISIPNSVLLNSNIVNYSKRAKDLGLILHTSVGIGYDAPWRLVDTMLKEAAGRTEGLLKQPPPFVLKRSLNTFDVTYEINAYCEDASKLFHYYNLLHQNILDLFNENNIQIMTPAYEGDPQIPKVVPRDQWDIPLSKDNNKE